jgi:hypothetical protein
VTDTDPVSHPGYGVPWIAGQGITSACFQWGTFRDHYDGF